MRRSIACVLADQLLRLNEKAQCQLQEAFLVFLGDEEVGEDARSKLSTALSVLQFSYCLNKKQYPLKASLALLGNKGVSGKVRGGLARDLIHVLDRLPKEKQASVFQACHPYVDWNQPKHYQALFNLSYKQWDQTVKQLAIKTLVDVWVNQGYGVWVKTDTTYNTLILYYSDGRQIGKKGPLDTATLKIYQKMMMASHTHTVPWVWTAKSSSFKEQELKTEAEESLFDSDLVSSKNLGNRLVSSLSPVQSSVFNLVKATTPVKTNQEDNSSETNASKLTKK